jgi:hypothetical protein
VIEIEKGLVSSYGICKHRTDNQHRSRIHEFGGSRRGLYRGSRLLATARDQAFLSLNLTPCIDLFVTLSRHTWLIEGPVIENELMTSRLGRSRDVPRARRQLERSL